MKEKPSFTLQELALRVGGDLAPSTKADVEVSGFTTLEEAGEKDLSFLASERFMKQARESKARALLLPQGLRLEEKTVIHVPHVWKSVVCVLNIFYPTPKLTGEIHHTAVIHPEARLGADVSVGPLSVIERGAVIGDHSAIGALCYIGENVKIGRQCLIHPNVTILRNCELGNRVILHPGAVIGSDGFKFEEIDGAPAKIPQVGGVVLEDDVDIGANACVDRASFTETRIGRGTKLDNLIQIAHNVKIGAYCMIAAQTGIAGSTRVGNGCVMGGQVGAQDNITIGDRVMVGAKSGVMGDIPSNSRIFGYIALPGREGLKREAMINRLPRLHETVRALEKRIRELEEGKQ